VKNTAQVAGLAAQYIEQPHHRQLLGQQRQQAGGQQQRQDAASMGECAGAVEAQRESLLFLKRLVTAERRFRVEV
jgi:hypothetical protein